MLVREGTDVMGGPGSGRKPQPLDPVLVQKIAHLYSLGLTQGEVGAELGLSQKVIHSTMKKAGLSARIAAKRNQWGSRNHAWRASAAGYKALHLRLTSRFGQPSRCEVCFTEDPTKSYDWANLSGKYDDLLDYKRMCRSCHRRYDAARRCCQ